MNRTATITLAIIACVAIIGAVVCGVLSVTGAVGATLGNIALACASGIIGYTVGGKSQAAQSSLEIEETAEPPPLPKPSEISSVSPSV
jgi:NADPH-dependent curcumin reductase CurA